MKISNSSASSSSSSIDVRSSAGLGLGRSRGRPIGRGRRGEGGRERWAAMSILWEKSEAWRWLVRRTRDSKPFFVAFATLCGVVPGVIGYCVMQMTSSRNEHLEAHLRRNSRPETTVCCSSPPPPPFLDRRLSFSLSPSLSLPYPPARDSSLFFVGQFLMMASSLRGITFLRFLQIFGSCGISFCCCQGGGSLHSTDISFLLDSCY